MVRGGTGARGSPGHSGTAANRAGSRTRLSQDSGWSCRRIGLVCYQVLGVFSQSEAVPGSILLVLSRWLPNAEVRPSFPAGRNYHPTSLTRNNKGTERRLGCIVRESGYAE